MRVVEPGQGKAGGEGPKNQWLFFLVICLILVAAVLGFLLAKAAH